jgi:hypothetical protein
LALDKSAGLNALSWRMMAKSNALSIAAQVMLSAPRELAQIHDPEGWWVERSSAAYYGQLARARLGLGTLALAAPSATPEKRPSVERLELVRAVEILYALDERPLIIPLMADVGDKLDDVGALSALGELAERYQDARGMLQLGKAALARGLPLDYYAFPTVGVPRYSPVARGRRRCNRESPYRGRAARIAGSLSRAKSLFSRGFGDLAVVAKNVRVRESVADIVTCFRRHGLKQLLGIAALAV